MKILLIVIGCLTISFTNHNGQNLSEKEIKLLCDNNLKKFVRFAGSEEKAVDKLIAFCLPDTIYNDNKRMIWHSNSPQKLIEMDYYASRKLQAFYWILKIYHSDYSFNKKKGVFCKFIDDMGESIWDYKDLNIKQKRYFYQVIIASPVSQKLYYDKLGYIKTRSEAYKKIESSFKEWYAEMKKEGIQYMRINKIQPLDTLNYKLEFY